MKLWTPWLLFCHYDDDQDNIGEIEQDSIAEESFTTEATIAEELVTDEGADSNRTKGC